MKKGCAVNIDSDFLWYIYESAGRSLDNLEKKLDMYVEGYAGHGISDLIYCIFCQSAVHPTRTASWFADALNRKTENGISVDYSDDTSVLPYKEAYEYGIEPVQYMLDKTRREGMRAWVSVRMNDCHHGEAATSHLRGNEFYEAKSKGLMLGDCAYSSYFKTCLDYIHPQVREKFLDYIDEIAERYDFDGIELDFMREIFCFDYVKHPDCYLVMNDFIRSVRKIIDKKSAACGRRIKLAVRLGRSIEFNKRFGFDAECWIKEGLVDVLVPSSRWNGTDTEMPINEWLDLAKGSGTEIWPGTEFFLSSPAINNAETVRGFAAQYFDEGAEKIYVYNFYREAYQDKAGEWKNYAPKDGKGEYTDQLRKIDEFNSGIWEAAQSSEVAHGGVRRHVLTNMENYLAPSGMIPFNPLPLMIEGESEIFKRTGRIENGCLLYLGIESGEKIPDVLFDDKAAELVGKADDAYYQVCNFLGGSSDGFGNTDYYVFKVTPSNGCIRKLRLIGHTKLKYVEIKAF